MKPVPKCPPPVPFAPEQLLRCPVCGTPNFSARGLRAHHCRAKADRARLTPAELEIAQRRAA